MCLHHNFLNLFWFCNIFSPWATVFLALQIIIAAGRQLKFFLIMQRLLSLVFQLSLESESIKFYFSFLSKIVSLHVLLVVSLRSIS